MSSSSSSEFSLLAEAERLALQSRDAHLSQAKLGYIHRVQVVVESVFMQSLIAASGPYDKLYPEIEAWALARHTDVAGDVAGALAALMERELMVWPPGSGGTNTVQEQQKEETANGNA